jgi:pimeloyl-ACP methyl ester carboxylesterase
VVTAAGLDDVVLYGQVMSGPVAALYAATHPECTRALILFNSYAATPRSDDYEAGRTPAEYEPLIAWVEQVCGSGHCLRASMPSVQVDDAQLRVLARIERQSMSPTSAIFRRLYATDIRAVLPAINASTLVLHTVENRLVPIEAGRHLAQHIPNARLVELPGADHVLFFGSPAGPVAMTRSKNS